MAKECFIPKNFTAERQAMIVRINGILAEYSKQRLVLSLRQLYYQLVSRDIIENSVRSYKRIGDLVSEARDAGLIDWDMIEDRGRVTVTPRMWDNPRDILVAATQGFVMDRWRNQPVHIEVMVEKAALEGVLIPVCRRESVRFTANKGYSSSSAMYETGQRISDMIGMGKEVHVLYLGDHDPSGIDMTRDVEERLKLYSRIDEEDETSIQVTRIALNMDQVEQYNPPENPAKLTDSRAEKYIEQYGDSSWELDALSPRVLADLVTNFILERRDNDIWDQDMEEENEGLKELEGFVEIYDKKHKAK